MKALTFHAESAQASCQRETAAAGQASQKQGALCAQGWILGAAWIRGWAAGLFSVQWPPAAAAWMRPSAPAFAPARPSQSSAGTRMALWMKNMLCPIP